VCYGAIRSLIEIASLALAQSTREEIFLRIADMGAHINSIPELAREVERSLKVDILPQVGQKMLGCCWNVFGLHQNQLRNRIGGGESVPICEVLLRDD